jgi:5-methylcytosine-specific restriction enzyme subunit McrC
MSNVIQVFEHSTLSIGGKFTPDHFKYLVHYNERHSNRFFAVGLDRIYFRNYVGVIQVGSLTIEVLPKADNAPDSPTQKRKWQGALVEMLKQSGFIRVASMSDARSRLRSSSLLDIYFESFLSEVAELVHHGLVRRYRQTCGDLPALKGRIIFQQQIAKNIVHRERFFTAHESYDRNNPFNQILRVALDVLVRVSSNPHLVALSRGLAIWFEDVESVEVTDRMFSRLPYTRNTERYRRALQLARLIILNYSPDVRGGREDVLAILFDMNLLFESFVYVQLKREEAKKALQQISFKAQWSSRFWSANGLQKSIRPDIIAQVGTGPNYERIVFDTKWKIPGDGKPSDADLQQMHVYNVQFGAMRSFLLYPKVGNQMDMQGRFSQGKALQPSFNHSCSMVFLELFDGNKLRNDLGKKLVEMLTSDSNDGVTH